MLKFFPVNPQVDKIKAEITRLSSIEISHLIKWLTQYESTGLAREVKPESLNHLWHEAEQTIEGGKKKKPFDNLFDRT